MLLPRIWVFLLAALAAAPSLRAAGQIQFSGVNLAGAEFGESHLPGIYDNHYTYPTAAEADYFIGQGMNIFRLPFRWERLQRAASGPLDAAELGRIQAFVAHATSQGAHVILDPHNYARYYHTNLIGSPQLPFAVFNDFWTRLAGKFRANDRVIFGLMNEPHTMSSETWRDAANGAIAAIRAAGATNLILVPGNGWTGAHSWLQSWYGAPNGTVMRSLADPANRYAFDAHQYLDGDSSGTSGECVSPTIGVERLRAFTAWCRGNGRKAFLGEFGVSTNALCLQAMTNMLAFVRDNADVWLGWTYWAAGPWWGGYMLSIEPQNGKDRPQMEFLKPYLALTQPALRMEGPEAFSFPAWPGHVYQAEAASPLALGEWIPRGAAAGGGAGRVTFSTSFPESAGEIYRVRVSRAPQ